MQRRRRGGGVDAARTRALRSLAVRRVTVTVTLRGLDIRYRASTVGAQRSVSVNEGERRRENGGEKETEALRGRGVALIDSSASLSPSLSSGSLVSVEFPLSLRLPLSP